jgi:hypothetical protein
MKFKLEDFILEHKLNHNRYKSANNFYRKKSNSAEVIADICKHNSLESYDTPSKLEIYLQCKGYILHEEENGI